MDGLRARGHDGLSHEALFYRDADEYVAGVGAFLNPGLDAGDAVVAAVPPHNLELLRRSLDGDRDRVRLIDMSELGRNPARIIPTVRALADRGGGAPLHFVGEPIWPGRSAGEVREATRHEALINLAWSDAPLRVLCPYDAAGLDESVLRDAEHTHPRLRDGELVRASERHRGHTPPASCDEELGDPPPAADTCVFGVEQLSGIRALVARSAADLPAVRVDDLVLAVNELASNALRHGGDCARLSLWRAGGVVCEIEGGGTLADPLAGRRQPSAGSDESRGLWIVNQLCDLVQIRNGPAGLKVRVLMR